MPGRLSRLAIVAILTLGAVAAPHAQIRYDVVEPSHLAKVSSSPCALDKNLKTLSPLTVASPMGSWTAVIEQTDPVSVAYGSAKGCIKLNARDGGRKLSVTIGDFRSLRVTWINERLLYIFTDVGHVAGVGQLLDVEASTWLYAKTEYYAAKEPAIGAHQPDAVVIEAAKQTNTQDIDPKLPKLRFELWLRSVVGTQPTMRWGVTDCGEQSGNPALDRGRDFPMCAEVIVTLNEKRELILDLAMGTFGKGLTGDKPVLYVGALKTGDKMQQIKALSEVPTLLVGRELDRTEPRSPRRKSF